MPEHLDTKQKLPEHVTTPLLTLLTQRSMDEDYAHVAQRRRSRGETPSAKRDQWSVVLLLAVFGLLATVVVVQTSRDSSNHELGRSALLSRISAARTEVDARQKRARSLSISTMQLANKVDALGTRLQNANDKRRSLEVVTGFAAAHGPGVRIRVHNPPDAAPEDEIQDADLATLVDGLWAAGAEAIAVNGQRLTMLTGIRNTGRAIHVGGRPLTAPYTLDVLGDSDTLQANLAESSEGRQWFAVVSALSFDYNADNADDLQLPAATWRSLRQARPMNTSKAPQEKGGDLG